MSYKINKTKMDQILRELSADYKIYGPKWDIAKKNVRYSIIKSVSDIVLDRQSNFSIKEAFYPISQVMGYFKADTSFPSEMPDQRGILIFARPCDINAIRRLDTIFLENGLPDMFYARMREKVKFILLECAESFDECFCVSMDSNQSDDYVMAVRFGSNPGDNSLDTILVQIKDAAFEPLFDWEEEADFAPVFVKENKKKMVCPDISRANLKAISDLDYWKQYDELCVGCGGCNTVCGTCSCFDTADVIYEEGKSDGERKRIWSSCMIPNFTETAGGNRSRKTQGANMRFKVFHKFFDFKARFGKENMCVGCGRCDMRCPQNISFFDAVYNLNDEIDKLKEQVTE